MYVLITLVPETLNEVYYYLQDATTSDTLEEQAFNCEVAELLNEYVEEASYKFCLN